MNAPRLLLLSLTGLLATVWPGDGAVSAEPLFVLEDAKGDDHGAGALVYPGRSEFEKGDLDLLSFSAENTDKGTWFEARFARRIKKPYPGAIDGLGNGLEDIARLGFFTFNIDVYIDTDRSPGSGSLELLDGRKATVAASDGWEKAVILTPRPQLTRGELLERSDRPELEVDARVFFPRLVRVSGRKVRFFVPERFLGGPAQADWGYLVAVSGANLLQTFDRALSRSGVSPLAILPVSPGAWSDRFGGGEEGAPLQPPFVDIVVPDGVTQEEALSSFRSRLERPAVLPVVVPATL